MLIIYILNSTGFVPWKFSLFEKYKIKETIYFRTFLFSILFFESVFWKKFNFILNYDE